MECQPKPRRLHDFSTVEAAAESSDQQRAFSTLQDGAVAQRKPLGIFVISAAVLVGACLGSGNSASQREGPARVEGAPPGQSTATTTQPESVEVSVPLHTERQVCTDVPDPSPRDGTKPVRIYLACPDWLYGHYLVGVTRLVPADAEPLPVAVRELLQGPTQVERDAGLFANFSPEDTGNALIEARVDNGRAIVNLHSTIIGAPALSNVGTSSGGFGFFGPLYATAFQFPEVKEILPQFDGDAEAWGDWDASGEGPFPRRTYPTAPVPIDEDGPIAAATYAAQVIHRFAEAPWFGTIRFIQPEGDGVGVRIDDNSPVVARQVADAVGRIFSESGRFCDVRDVDVRNGADDRSNLASARKAQSGSGVPVHCWADGYELLA
jgi:hypothetical protein